jgi:hypothetical protein
MGCIIKNMLSYYSDTDVFCSDKVYKAQACE